MLAIVYETRLFKSLELDLIGPTCCCLVTPCSESPDLVRKHTICKYVDTVLYLCICQIGSRKPGGQTRVMTISKVCG